VGRAHLDGEKQAPCTATAALRSAGRSTPTAALTRRGEAAVGKELRKDRGRFGFGSVVGVCFSENSHGRFGKKHSVRLPDARAHEGEMALGRAGGKERGRGGWGEPAEMGQGRGGGLISISPFLSLFYLFQFDIMCKLMIK
jgi:hypothetical protein